MCTEVGADIRSGGKAQERNSDVNARWKVISLLWPRLTGLAVLGESLRYSLRSNLGLFSMLKNCKSNKKMRL